ncbi:MAG: SDR family oxidoreductase [Geminicoccaceae bacterium]
MILAGRVAIVTGAGAGIGFAGARRMALAGAKVVIADRDSRRSDEAAEHIGHEAMSVPTDVTDDKALQHLVTRTLARHGQIDILHNHAGVQIEGNLEEVAADGMDRSWQVNVRAHFMLARLVVPHMKVAGGGVILNTSSNSGVIHDAGMIAYCTSKHAIIAMTKQMAKDYARDGIRVNALCPGWVDTAFNEPFMRQMGGREALLRYVEKAIPMGRFATPDEIAESILFLVSDRSSFMTGHAMVIDGGESL